MKNIYNLAIEIVNNSKNMKDSHAKEFADHVSYCCFFSQSISEFNEINSQASSIGFLAKDTPTGPVYIIDPIQTDAGELRVFKVRKPDPTRTELGDADFAIQDYQAFKRKNLGRPGFKLIERDEFEMLELVDQRFNVRAYFSNPPVEQHSGIREALKVKSNNSC